MGNHGSRREKIGVYEKGMIQGAAVIGCGNKIKFLELSGGGFGYFKPETLSDLAFHDIHKLRLSERDGGGKIDVYIFVGVIEEFFITSFIQHYLKDRSFG